MTSSATKKSIRILQVRKSSVYARLDGGHTRQDDVYDVRAVVKPYARCISMQFANYKRVHKYDQCNYTIGSYYILYGAMIKIHLLSLQTCAIYYITSETTTYFVQYTLQ